MSKKRKPPLFRRSFHMTLGGITLILPVFIWITDGSHSSTWPVHAWILLFSLPMAGVFFLLFGIFASDQKIDSTRIATIENNFFIAILAVPLYLILKGIQRKKREQLLHKKHDR